jgi:hypothetical protein
MMNRLTQILASAILVFAAGYSQAEMTQVNPQIVNGQASVPNARCPSFIPRCPRVPG